MIAIVEYEGNPLHSGGNPSDDTRLEAIGKDDVRVHETHSGDCAQESDEICEGGHHGTPCRRDPHLSDLMPKPFESGQQMGIALGKPFKDPCERRNGDAADPHSLDPVRDHN